MIVCFAYVAYEGFLLVCTLCTSPVFMPGNDVVVVNTTPQYVGLGGYGANQVIVT